MPRLARVRPAAWHCGRASWAVRSLVVQATLQYAFASAPHLWTSSPPVLPARLTFTHPLAELPYLSSATTPQIAPPITAAAISAETMIRNRFPRGDIFSPPALGLDLE